MRSVCIAAISLIAVLPLGIDAAHAQVRKFDFSVFLGVRTFAADSELGAQNLDNVKVKNSAIFGPRFHYLAMPWLLAEGEFPVAITSTTAELPVLFIHPRVQANFMPMPEATVQPAVLAGFGIASSDYVGDGELVPQGHLGVGVRFPKNTSWTGRLDLRWMIGPSREDGLVNEFELLFSVYRPTPPDKVARRSGPVTRDSDGDGLIDREDKCPDEPEDEDGFEDEDGCPDDDNDGDDVLDKDDKCPLKPENHNDYQDEDGCPDQIPEKMRGFTGTIPGIQFETDSANLRKSSFAILDQAVDVLKEYKDLEVVIVGHTDDVGTDEYNFDLSQRRAETVMRYLISRGIDEARLKAVGMGKTEPVTDNDSEEGRAQNRRVEFHVK